MKWWTAVLWLLMLVAVGATVWSQTPPDNTYFRPFAARSAGELLAGIIDIGADSSGRVIVADGKRGIVLLLDADLRVIGQVGRKGSGPGEYREIQAVQGTRGGFVTADRVLRRLYVYNWAGSRPQLAHTITLDFEPYDFCVPSKGKFIVLGRRNGARLHILDSINGAIVQSGARFAANVSVALSDNVVEGRLSCGGSKMILLTSAWVPSFDLIASHNIEITRTDSIGPVRKLAITQTKGRLSFSSGPQGYQSPSRAFEYDRNWILPAATIARIDGVEDDSSFYFLRTADGAAIANWKRNDKLFPISRDSAVSVVETLEIVLKKVAIADVVREGMANATRKDRARK